jgi:multidrug efflux system membrane fusion protein
MVTPREADPRQNPAAHFHLPLNKNMTSTLTRNKKILVAGAAILVVAIAAAWYFWPKSAEEGGKGEKPAEAGAGQGAKGPGGQGGRGGRFGFDPSKPQPVQGVPARKADINVVQTGLGTAAAARTATVKVRVDGLLQNVLFREGQNVRAGDVLAQIDPEPFKVALAQVEGQYARDQAQLANAKLDLERYRTLLAQDSIARQQLDQQEALVRQFEAALKIDQAQVDNAKLQLSYTRVTAPIGGRLGLKQVDSGNMVRSSDTNGIAVITEIDPISVLFTIPQDNLGRVLTQLKAGEKLAVDAWDREQKIKLATGFLVSVDNQIDVTTGTVKLKAQFPNPDGLLFPNQFVNVRMVVNTLKDATVIPVAAVQRGAQGTIVYVVKEDKTVNMRPVKLGPAEGERVAVESGVAPGETVVTDGVDRLREGAKVEVTAPRVFGPPPMGGGGGRRGQGKPGEGKPGEGKPAGPGGAPAPAAAPAGAAPSGAAPASSGAPAGKSAPSGKAPASSEGKPANVRVPPEPPQPQGEGPRGPGGPDGPPRRGGFGGVSEEQKAAMREKMKNMTDEQKAEFIRQMRERRKAEQGGQ